MFPGGGCAAPRVTAPGQKKGAGTPAPVTSFWAELYRTLGLLRNLHSHRRGRPVPGSVAEQELEDRQDPARVAGTAGGIDPCGVIADTIGIGLAALRIAEFLQVGVPVPVRV